MKKLDKIKLKNLLSVSFSYMEHSLMCSFHHTEFCDCGMVKIKDNIKKFYNTKVLKVKK